MPTKLKSTGVEFPDGTTQTSVNVPTSAMPAGSVIQVVQNTSTTGTATTSTPLLDVEPSVTITPLSSNNKILVMHTAGGIAYQNQKEIRFELQRDGVSVWVANRYGFKEFSGEYVPIPFNASYLDSPNTTSSITYNFAIKAEQSGDLRHNDSGTAITIAMEIAG